MASPIGPELFTFLRALKRNNNRPWFQSHKDKYLQDVQEPCLEFIRAVQPILYKISPQLLADPRPVGGSMFRIYRDTRFSKDKTPYKTHAALHFRHKTAKDVHAPGVYLHLEPGEVYVGAGLWRPEPDLAGKIRRSIAANGPAWKRAISSKAFQKRCTMDGESLVRPPKGFPPDHPLINELKRKDFIAGVKMSEKSASAKDFLQQFGKAVEVMAPMMEFLTRAVGLPFQEASRRVKTV
jgi:uncharacterized protein (TIGR02453 family)